MLERDFEVLESRRDAMALHGGVAAKRHDISRHAYCTAKQERLALEAKARQEAQDDADAQAVMTVAQRFMKRVMQILSALTWMRPATRQ